MTESESTVPPCGLYRTTQEVAGVPAGRLVSFHNHGDPGPGVYLPSSWTLNKATFQEKGHTLPEPWQDAAEALEPLPAEGFYRVAQAFYCCPRKCRQFPADLFVQLGYDGEAKPILFVPELTANGVAIPDVGTVTDLSRLASLVPLKVQARSQTAAARSPGRGDLH